MPLTITLASGETRDKTGGGGGGGTRRVAAAAAAAGTPTCYDMNTRGGRYFNMLRHEHAGGGRERRARGGGEQQHAGTRGNVGQKRHDQGKVIIIISL